MSAVVEYTQLRSLPMFSLRTISGVTARLSAAIPKSFQIGTNNITKAAKKENGHEKASET
jgi:hypothetical protein